MFLKNRNISVLQDKEKKIIFLSFYGGWVGLRHKLRLLKFLLFEYFPYQHVFDIFLSQYFLMDAKRCFELNETYGDKSSENLYLVCRIYLCKNIGWLG